MTLRRLALVPLLALAACASPPPELAGRLIVLRHADRTFAPLNEAGHARAEALPAALEGVGIDAIYVTDRGRNIDTARPLARARGLPIRVIAAQGAHLRLLTENPGKTIVWIGNQENLGFFYAGLGLGAKPPVQFGEVDLIEIGPAEGPRLYRAAYGTCAPPKGRAPAFARTAPPGSCAARPPTR